MKNNRNGQAEILREDPLEELLGTLSPKHKLLFGICYYTSCRISEALKLEQSDFISDRIIFRAATTKTKKTREKNFRVLAPDPHRFDGRDKDGIGCEG